MAKIVCVGLACLDYLFKVPELPNGGGKFFADHYVAAPGGPAAPAIIPDPKAKAKPKAKPAPQNLNWCRAFLTQAGCPKSAADCDYPHLDNEAAKLCKQKQDRAKAKAKAKAAAAEG